MIIPFVSYDFTLIAAAVIPAIILLVKVYRSDRLEPESPKLLVALVIAGILSSMLALIEEIVLEYALDMLLSKDTVLYNLLLYFIVVAFSEESSKYLLMKRKTWKNPEFNCRFDGIVYAVFTSLGFALWENISYVFSYGIGTAVVRAVTAIPGHACFGVFMGIFYSIAKEYDYRGNKNASSFFRKLAVIVSVLLHGAYDFLATVESGTLDILFYVFIALMFFISYKEVGKLAKKDKYMSWHLFN